MPGIPGTNPLYPTSNGALAERADPTSWSIWWALNQPRYLDLRRRVNGLATATGDGGFYLGAGAARESGQGGRLSRKQVVGELAPALLEAIRVGGDLPLVNSLMVALAKVGDPADPARASRYEFTLGFFLDNELQGASEQAVLALGILGNAGSVTKLEHLLADDATGRELVGREEVPERTRTFAAFALGLIGQRSEDGALKRRVVRALFATLRDQEAREAASKDLQVAAVVALGLVRLDVDESCECGGSEHEPDTSRQALMYALLKYFCEPDEHPWQVRAHCATALAKQLANLDGDRFKQPTADALTEALKQSSREQLAVRQSCILALGLIGDADDDAVDRGIRTTLMRMTGHAEEQCRRFAILALGQVGGRPGDDADEPLGAAPEVRSFLLKRLSSGKQGSRAWAGLALGVMGHDLQRNGELPSEDVTRALRAALSRARDPETFGAHAIALGLRRDAQAVPLLLRKLRSFRDAEPLGHAALALGMIGEPDALEPLQELIEEARVEPGLHREAAVGLALLGDRMLAGRLLATLRDPAAEAVEKETAAVALSYVGDARHLDELVGALADRELDDRLRGFVAMALGQMADSQTQPWNAPLAMDVNYLAGTASMTNPEGTGVIDRR